MKTSTNALAKRYAERQGWIYETVQQFYGGRRHDLFGVGDGVVLGPESAGIIQNCSYGSLKAHQDAMEANPNSRAIVAARLVLECWEWRRKKLKRGGTNKGREWYVRSSRFYGGSGWTPPTGWIGPLDLYPKKTKA